MNAAVTPQANGIRLAIRLQPRASRNQVVGMMGDRLKIALTAPPVEGAANAACQAYLADLFKVSKGSVTLIGGEKSRDKLWEIAGDPAQLAAIAASLA
ncbi:hypothetical protein D3C72_131560 [compost metagenome]